MRVKVLSKYFMIRNSIEQMLNECFETKDKYMGQIEKTSDIETNRKNYIDYILFNLTTSNVYELEKIKK